MSCIFTFSFIHILYPSQKATISILNVQLKKLQPNNYLKCIVDMFILTRNFDIELV